ncbi:MAG: YfiR family protein [Desulfuromonadales bacterium]|nr:YfiR family protein [Desulfuromonadales bacterium]
MVLRWLVILLLSLLSPTLSCGQEDEVPQEYLVKAKYLLNLPLFIEMPSPSKNSASFTTCLIGDTPLENILVSSRGKLIKNRPLAIRRIEDPGQVDGCQMLFIASSERHNLQKLLTEAHRRGILTISDMRNFARLGGMISLLTVDNRVTFDLNRSAAGKASISFSSHLLKLAHDVIN